MPSPDYQHHRDIAQQLSDATRSISPCQRGGGMCCERGVPVTPDDEEFIREGIASGDISPAVVAQAKVNAADSTRQRCPFLSGQSECTIYGRRPVICLYGGVPGAGLPRNPAVYMAALDALTQGLPDPGVTSADVMQPSCAQCVSQMGRCSSVPMIAFQEFAHAMADSGSTPMNEVVRRLP